MANDGIVVNSETLDELRARLQKMTGAELLTYGKAAAYMCSPHANFGQAPLEVWATQLREARAEWRRRHPSPAEGAAGAAQASTTPAGQ